MTKNIVKVFILYVFVLLLGLAFSSCSDDPSPRGIKPESEKETKKDDEIKVKTFESTPKSQPAKPVISEPAPPSPDREIIIKNMLQGFHTGAISQAIMFYRDSYDKMPEKIEDLLDGWMLFWPMNLYTHEPVKILDHKPDAENKDDFGNFYYERVNDDTAYFYFIGLDQENSTKDNVIWNVTKQDILYESVLAAKDPGNSKYAKNRELQKQPQEARIEYYYTMNNYRNLILWFTKAMLIMGEFEIPLTDILKEIELKVSPEGLEFFKEALNKGWFSFDIGSVGDGEKNYFNFYGLGQNIESCWKVLPDLGTMGTVDKNVDCPEDMSGFNSIFSSKNIDAFTIPADLKISKEDIR